MLSKIKSISLTGLEGNLVEVQTDIRNGIPEFEIVGLPDIRVKESKKRIESAIRNSQIEFPSKKILINLAPANIRKEGSSFDTCKGAFDTLKEGITDLRFYLTASNNIEYATYLDNV